MPLRVGVVGLGGIGRRHVTTYQQDGLSELVGVCDMDRARADAVAKQFGVPAYYDLGELIVKERLDILSVATAGPENGGHHFAPTMQALEAGVNVLVEKPLSNSLDEAKQLVATATRLGRYLAVDLNHRFSPATDKAKAMIDRGDLGHLLYVNMDLCIRNLKEGWPYFHVRALHSHSVDVMRFFAGDVARVHAFFSKAPGREIWSTATINLQFESGCLGHLTGSWDMSMNHSFERTELAGQKGRLVIDNSTVDLIWYPHDSREEVFYRNVGGVTSFSETMPARLHRFLGQVSAGVPSDRIEGSGLESLKAQAVVEAAIKSHETGQIVEVAPLLS